jgi:hypothetical protein
MEATAARGRVAAARCRAAAAGPVTAAVYAMRMTPVAAALASSYGRQGRHVGSRRNRRASASCARTRLA